MALSMLSKKQQNSDTQRLLLLVINLKDSISGYSYQSVNKIGILYPEAGHDDEVKRRVATFIKSSGICKAHIQLGIIRWAIPKVTPGISFLFTNNQLTIDLNRSLGIPNYEMNVLNLMIKDIQIEVVTTPDPTTVLVV